MQRIRGANPARSRRKSDGAHAALWIWMILVDQSRGDGRMGEFPVAPESSLQPPLRIVDFSVRPRPQGMSDARMDGRSREVGSFRVATSLLSDASTTTTWTWWAVERRRSDRGKMLRRLGNGVWGAAVVVGSWALDVGRVTVDTDDAQPTRRR